MEGIWASGRLTNDGPVLRRFEAALHKDLGWDNVAATSSGTMALQLACRALQLDGEVITPAFTFPATLQALRWNGLVPVLADVEPRWLTLDPASAAALVTPRTCAIVAVHTFGHPADVAALQLLASRYGLALVYDAAPAVGVRVDGVPVTAFGDASAVSFHATKVMHTIEGGAVCTPHDDAAEAVRRLRNFGLGESGGAQEYGTNAKMNELQAAVGLSLLRTLDVEVAGRAQAAAVYRELLKDVSSVRLLWPADTVNSNHAYAVARLRAGTAPLADKVSVFLDRHGVDSRRYFSQQYRSKGALCPSPTPVADAAAEDVLCLPLWGDIPLATVERVGRLVAEAVA
ncbi:DegT/DnrJ/EryC1/StrS family aminotransferase [Streptomyces arenae]|uniref:DegT/DnrJ/EryC1/StrS family aminotransferase n=1 Tax=Streptomyces arenae TaxID=29301 RepID=UPI0026587759|nr:DegT/DnrJ/EryC1/StrS family aminotransferase [Streptomyces arenae]MCG7210156.1 DegT/DnrJ/EryC1/StrS family aminotransferase [Streptomyces arenae]